MRQSPSLVYEYGYNLFVNNRWDKPLPNFKVQTIYDFVYIFKWDLVFQGMPFYRWLEEEPK